MRPLLFALLSLASSMDADAKTISKLHLATFAGGCFWCMQPPFAQLKGVSKIVAGYTGGEDKDPTYEDYIAKGHTEAVQVTFDPAKISYTQLLDVFWRNINPTDPAGQFADRGPGYYAGIYYHDEKQKAEAEKSKKALDKSGKFDQPVVTPILPYKAFYAAEEYHQFYSEKNPARYYLYKQGSGRAGFLEKMWGKGK